MHPVLIRIGPAAIRTYGFLLALAFVLGILVAGKRAKKQGLSTDWLPDLSLIILISAIVGSRFFYVIYHLEEFQGHILDMINPVQSSGDIGIGGLSMFGGLVLAIGCGLLYIYLKKLNVWRITDVVAPSVMLGLGIARIGCFLNGCCFGTPSHSCLAVVFPYNSPAGYTYPDTAIFPIQLVASLFGFGIFGLLLLLERYKSFDGFTFWLMLIFYPIARFTVDFFRYYEENAFFIHFGQRGLTINQVLSALVFLFALVMWFYLRSRARAKRVTNSA
jgi:phosphatidylglycerol:prolipoprotein diacylglycerol transferase